METKSRHEREVQEIARWRRERLAETGFPLPLARWIALDEQYDVHALIELVERGCPPELAVRILAPVDQERSAA